MKSGMNIISCVALLRCSRYGSSFVRYPLYECDPIPPSLGSSVSNGVNNMVAYRLMGMQTLSRPLLYI